MHKSLVILTIAGIIFGSIIIVWQLVPLLTQEQLKVTWTTEAENYRKDGWMTKVFIMSGVPSEVVDTVVGEAVANAEEIANQTDNIVHLIDLRVGMALTWWEESQNGSRFEKRYSWNEESREKSLEKKLVWERLIEEEGLVGVPETALPIKWDFGAVKYYYNPGDPQFGVPDQPDVMVEVLRLEAGEDRAQFRDMVANATTKAEELANATDKVVHLDDLREAIAIILYQYNKYPTLEEARTGLAAREQEIGYTPP